MSLMSKCQRFSHLLSESQDRDLSAREQKFMDQHREACSECRVQDEATDDCFAFLRMSAIEPDPLPASFDERIVRLVKLETKRNGFGYWSPALLGAGVACVAIFAALHVAATPVKPDVAKPDASQARNTVKSAYPRLELDRVPQFRQ